MAATHVEKSTVAHGALNAVPSGDGGSGASGAQGGFGGVSGGASNAGGFNAAAVEAAPAAEADGPVCMMRPGDAGFDECEACQ
jgi:ribonucleoside-diphosphate reductase alpha chain